MALVELIKEFDQTLDDLLALFLDSDAALTKWHEFLVASQQQTAANLQIPISQLDKAGFFYGKGDPNDPKAVMLLRSTQGDAKDRNAKGGKNHVLLGQRFIVDVYTYWEDEYRSKIAASAGKLRNGIVADIFGDVRLVRNSIIHHRGIALPEVERCKILQWFKTGEPIVVDQDRVETVVIEARQWLDSFCLAETGKSPGLMGRAAPTGHPRL